jgi:hypothetical protein
VFSTVREKAYGSGREASCFVARLATIIGHPACGRDERNRPVPGRFREDRCRSIGILETTATSLDCASGFFNMRLAGWTLRRKTA